MSEHVGEPGSVELMIQRDHNVVAGLLDRFDREAVGDWAAAFREFLDYEVRHEVAERSIVHRALREAVPRAADVLDSVESEERAVMVRLGIMEALDPADPEFREHLGHLRDEIAAHVAHEEQVLLPMLRGQGEYDLGELARRYDVARTTAPTAPAAAELLLMPGASHGDPAGADGPAGGPAG